MRIKFNTGIYSASYTITDSKEEWMKLYKKVFNEEHEPDGVGICGMKYPNFIIGVFDGTLSTLEHELDHAAISMFEHIGMDITDRASEAYCYFKQYVKSMCLDKLGLRDSIYPDPRIAEMEEEIKNLKEQLAILKDTRQEPASHEYKTGE